MNSEILNALLSIINQGGTLALWGIAIWLVMGLARLLVVCLAVYFSIRIIAQACQSILKTRLEIKATQVSVLTNSVSTHLVDTLADYHKSVTAILNDIDKHLNGSKKKSEEKTA